MAPHEIKGKTLKELRALRRAMADRAFRLALRRQPKAEQRKAGDLRFEVEMAIDELELAQLTDIRDRLQANEGDLQAGITSLQGTLNDLGRVEAILGAATSFLGIVKRVVTII